MKIACLSFTTRADQLGEGLVQINDPAYKFYHFSNSSLEGGVKALLSEKWSDFDGFVFISATGIAVRMILPYIESKTTDPAILVVDENGKFVISLLSGHLGGANDLTSFIADQIGARPVITTASDGRGIDSVDMFAKRNNYYIQDIDSVSKITALMLDDIKIAIYSEDHNKIKYDHVEYIDTLENISSDIGGLIIVSSKEEKIHTPILSTLLRPRVINIGIGSRKDIQTKVVIEAIEQALDKKNLSPKSIKSMGTVDVKENEKGIIEAAEFFKSDLLIFTRDQIRQVEDKFEKSDFVLKTIGISSVSEPCAHLLGGEIILNKYRYKGVTVSLSM